MKVKLILGHLVWPLVCVIFFCSADYFIKEVELSSSVIYSTMAVLFIPFLYVFLSYITHDLFWSVQLHSDKIIVAHNGASKIILLEELRAVYQITTVGGLSRLFPFPLYFIRFETKNNAYVDISCLSLSKGEVERKLNMICEVGYKAWPSIK